MICILSNLFWIERKKNHMHGTENCWLKRQEYRKYCAPRYVTQVLLVRNWTILKAFPRFSAAGPRGRREGQAGRAAVPGRGRPRRQFLVEEGRPPALQRRQARQIRERDRQGEFSLPFSSIHMSLWMLIVFNVYSTNNGTFKVAHIFLKSEIITF